MTTPEPEAWFPSAFSGKTWQARLNNTMKISITVVFFALIACAQKPDATLPKLKRAPSLSFIQTRGEAAVVDTDMFDAQKYVEESGSDSSAAKARRTSHEEALTRDFFAGFNDAKECDGIIFKGKGDQKPEFTLQIMVDSHDTPGQKPVWIWILADAGKNKFIVKGEEDSNVQAARSVCLAVWKAAEDAELKAAWP